MAIQRVVEDGVKPSEIASEYGFCETICILGYRSFGTELGALAERIAEGPTPKLTEGSANKSSDGF